MTEGRDQRSLAAARLSWLSSPDRALAVWSLTPEKITTGRSRSGNRANDAGLALPIGRVFAAVSDREIWGGVDALACDAMLAREDVENKTFIPLDALGGDTPGLEPFNLEGEQKNIRRATPNEVIIVRGADVGPDFDTAHVAFTQAGGLVADNRGQNAPDASSTVSDDDWEAGLHSVFRVVPWIINPGSTVGEQEDPFAIALNFAGRGAGPSSLSPGFGAADFGAAASDRSNRMIGLLSAAREFGDIAAGPLMYGAPKQKVGDTQFGGEVRHAAIDVLAHYGNGEDTLTAPHLFTRVPYAAVPIENGGGPYTKRVDRVIDPNPSVHESAPPSLFHNGNPGQSLSPRQEDPTVWRDQHYSFWNSYPEQLLPENGLQPIESPPGSGPPGGPPPPPPPGGGNPPGGGGPDGEGDKNKLKRASTTTPDEVEAPSRHGHPKPGVPEEGSPSDKTGDDGILPGVTGIDDDMFSQSDRIQRYWNNRYGFNEEEFLRTPIVSHQISIPVYIDSTANENAGSLDRRWDTEKSVEEEITFDRGHVVARQPALGPGSELFAPGGIKGPEIFGRKWLTQPDDFGLIVAAGENDDGLILDGRFGIGVRAHQSAFVASGFEFSLSFAGAGGSTVPDIQLHTKDAAAANSTSGVFYFNDKLVATEGFVIMSVSTEALTFDGVYGRHHNVTAIGVTADLPEITSADIGKIIEIRNESGSEVSLDGFEANTVNGVAVDILPDGDTYLLRALTTSAWVTV